MEETSRSLLVRYMAEVLRQEGISFRPEEPDRWFTEAEIDYLRDAESEACVYLNETNEQRIADARQRLSTHTAEGATPVGDRDARLGIDLS